MPDQKPRPCDRPGCESEATRRVFNLKNEPMYLCDSHAADSSDLLAALGHDGQSVAIDPDVQKREAKEREEREKKPA